jgi:hypothetical protein
MTQIDAFPLHWPTGYQRSVKRISSSFKQTMDASQRFLRAELKRLKATDLIVSSNIPVRKDGGLYTDYMNRKLPDPGVAIYFKYKGKDISMCCDKYVSVWENIYALGKGIEALRGMERWGVSDFLDRAFTGFTALPESTSSKPSWSEALQVSENATPDEVKKSYRRLVKEHHPDKGGDPYLFGQIVDAFSDYLRNLES